MQIVNQTVPRALRKLGYVEEQIEAIVEFIAGHGHVLDAPGLRREHYEVFDCAVGTQAIKAMGHVSMMAAVQPFISGAISKTVNLPESATVEDIADVYTQGWKLGLKALAVYRDNCKVGQPLSTEKSSGTSSGTSSTTSEDSSSATTADSAPTVSAGARPATAPIAADTALSSSPGTPPTPGAVSDAAAGTQARPAAVPEAASAERRPVRRRLPKARPSRTTSFSVAGAEGYMTAGSYPDDGLGEVFLKLGKQGSTLAGMMDAFSIAISIALQYGVPLETYVQKFTNMRFEPAGLTDDADVRMAQSVVDYVFRRLALDHLSYETRAGLGIHSAQERIRQVETGSYLPPPEVDPTPATLVELAGGPDGDLDADLDQLRQSVPGQEHLSTVSAGPRTSAHAVTAPLTATSHEQSDQSDRGQPGGSPAPVVAGGRPRSSAARSTPERLEALQGKATDAPLCVTCGTTMRPSGSCYVCEGCGSTSGCS